MENSKYKFIINDNLLQYKHLKKEEKKIKEKIDKLERRIKKLKEKGVVKGEVYDQLTLALETKKAIWKELYVQIEEAEVNIELFLANITLENPAMARIIDMRFIKDMTWKEIAICMGGKATEDSVKKAFERFIKKQKAA